MIRLDVDNVYTQLGNIDKPVLDGLWDLLKFKVEVYGKDPRYRHLLNRKTMLTYTGLLPYVTHFLKEQGEEFEIVDHRERIAPNANFALVNEINGTPLAPRPYQQEIIDGAKPREVIQCATGGGKTFLMAALVAKFNVRPVRVFADKITLCEQLQSEFSKFLGCEVGIVGDGRSQIRDVTVCSLQSVTEDMVNDAAMIMFDECFIYGQLVRMADNSLRRIGELVEENLIGAEVMSMNVATGERRARRITAVYRRPFAGSGKRMTHLTVRLINGQLRHLQCTDDHKIFTVERGYVRARDLTEDLTLHAVTTNGNAAVTGHVVPGDPDLFSPMEPTWLYDITVDEDHNFFADDVLVSNCHHVPADTCASVAAMAKNAYYRIGVSATPWRDAGDDMLIDAILAPRNHANDINASKLIKLGFLVKPSIYFVPVKLTYKGTNYNSVYTKAIVENEARNKMIRKIVQQMYKRARHVLVLVTRIDHGKKLLEMINEALGTANLKHTVTIEDARGRKLTQRVGEVEFIEGGDDSARKQAVLEGVRMEKCRVLIATTIADEGLDLPILDTLVLAGGGKSSTRAFQRIGRVLRPFKGKEKAVVFDFTDYTPMLRRHSRTRKRLYKTEDEWDIGEFIVNPDD